MTIRISAHHSSQLVSGGDGPLRGSLDVIRSLRTVGRRRGLGRAGVVSLLRHRLIA